MNSLYLWMRYLAWTASLVFLVVSIPYFTYQQFGTKFEILATTAVLLTILAIGLKLPTRVLLADEPLAKATERYAVIILVLLGITLRAWFSENVPPIQLSDFLDYVNAAHRINLENRYYYPTEHGDLLAWRPPGYPILLSLVFKLAGDSIWIPFFLNILFFAITCFSIRKLAQCLQLNNKIAVAAIAMLSVWPNFVIGSALASSEWISLALLTTSILACCRAHEARRYVLIAGICMGFGILVRPGLLYLPVCFLLWVVCSAKLSKTVAVRHLLILLITYSVVAPWTIRNAQVLDSFIPVSTNGGSVFYRANNPNATGGWQYKGELDIDALSSDEVLWNKTGFKWGIEWIKSDPLAFAILAIRKQSIFFGDDQSSAYWTLDRTDRNSGYFYGKLSLISNLWWILVLVMAAIGTVRYRAQLRENRYFGLVVGTMVYILFVHSVFESQSRHHQPLYAFLALLASLSLFRPGQNQMSSTSSDT